MSRVGWAVALLSLLTVSAARAEEAEPVSALPKTGGSPQSGAAPPAAAPPAVAPAPARQAPHLEARSAGAVVPAADVEEEAGPVRPADSSYGAALIGRWVSIPRWLLDTFTKKNMPLSSFGVGAQMFRRKGNFQVAVTFMYQDMSPREGNWLGKDHPADTETDYVQFRNVGLYALDVSFIWTQMLSSWFGVHYGAGLGFGVVSGHILRTSNGSGCTEANAGDPSQCHPIGVDCPNGICSDQQLQGLGPGPDDPNNPHRFTDPNLPPVLPIVNVVLGIDFRLPNVRGWEARIEGGFYDAFVFGGAVAYTF